MTDDISDALHRAAELLPDSPDRLAGVRRKRVSRVRRRAAAATAVLALVGAGTAYGLTRGGGGGAAVVVPAGDTTELTASGRVVEVPGKPPRLCAATAMTLELRIPKPPPAWCDLGVDVQGVDFATLTDRYEKAGAVEGRATLVGHLDGDVLVVTSQAPPRAEPGPPFALDPPCTPPAGGWRDYGQETNPDVSAAQAFRAAHPDLIAELAIARPSRTQAMPFLLTWGDPEPVREALRDSYGEQVCVLQSRWTREQVTSAEAELRPDDMGSLGVYLSSGTTLTKDGQLQISAEAVKETPTLSAMAARHPAELFRITYWLHPVAS